jgi:hypothetical protein
MRVVLFTGSLLLSFFLAFIVNAKAKTSAIGSGKVCAKLIEAYSQRTIPGTQESPIITKLGFQVKWLCSERPTSFFWKGKDGWMTCIVSKIKDGEKTEIAPEDVKKGDVLELEPIKGGKFPMVKSAAKLKEVILFKTNKSNWRYLSVGKISKKPDIIMQ